MKPGEAGVAFPVFVDGVLVELPAGVLATAVVVPVVLGLLTTVEVFVSAVVVVAALVCADDP